MECTTRFNLGLNNQTGLVQGNSNASNSLIWIDNDTE